MANGQGLLLLVRLEVKVIHCMTRKFLRGTTCEVSDYYIYMVKVCHEEPQYLLSSFFLMGHLSAVLVKLCACNCSQLIGSCQCRALGGQVSNQPVAFCGQRG